MKLELIKLEELTKLEKFINCLLHFILLHYIY